MKCFLCSASTIVFLFLIGFLSSCQKDELEPEAAYDVFDPEQFFPEDQVPILEIDRQFPLITGGDTTWITDLNGRKIIEGDILLPEGADLEFDTMPSGGVQLRANILPSLRIWPNKTVYYRFHSRLPNAQRRAFLIAAREWNKRTGIRFVSRTNQRNYIQVIRDNGNYSPAGMQGGAQPLSLLDSDVGTAVHEIGHALGLMHEHTRSDRDRHVRVNRRLQRDRNYRRFNTLNCGTFDWSSIMLYGSRYDPRIRGYNLVRASNGRPFTSATEWYRNRYGSSTRSGRYAVPSSRDASCIRALYR